MIFLFFIYLPLTVQQPQITLCIFGPSKLAHIDISNNLNSSPRGYCILWHSMFLKYKIEALGEVVENN